jgi:hypothetical protein
MLDLHQGMPGGAMTAETRGCGVLFADIAGHALHQRNGDAVAAEATFTLMFEVRG